MKLFEDTCVSILTGIVLTVCFLKDSFLDTRKFCIDFWYGNQPDPEVLG